MAIGPEAPGSDPQLRRARIATLGALGAALLTSLIMPGIGLLFERSAVWIVLGVLGIVAFVVAQAGALYGVVTPWMAEATRRRLLAGFAAAAVLSVPLVGSLGADEWETWAWLGGSIVGSAPLLVRRQAAALVMVATLTVAVGVAWWTDGSVGRYILITVSIGLSVAAMSGLPAWLWDLLAQAQAGRAAQARLATTQERLRFARDVHDLLGHNLSVIALKAELAARLAPIDAERAAEEAAEVQRLAASALTEMREAVHGYRAVNLREQLTAVAQVLRSSGVRCTVTHPTGELPSEIATQLAPVLREASTNVLRHSKAGWCTIEIIRQGKEVRMIVANDGAAGAGPDRHSFGLRGLAERLADAGGTLHTRDENGVFTLVATVPEARIDRMPVTP
ncbi:MAG: histidine kinase [Actinomycetota bacterium]|nr:histidine kinase [Actinomycetota bacterium]